MTSARKPNSSPTHNDIAHSFRINKSEHSTPRRDDKSRDYWIDQVFMSQGWCWATDLVETESVDCRPCWDVRHVCLGSAAQYQHQIIKL